MCPLCEAGVPLITRLPIIDQQSGTVLLLDVGSTTYTQLMTQLEDMHLSISDLSRPGIRIVIKENS
jgi:hypothetical protein